MHLRTGGVDLAIEEAQEVLKREPKSVQAHLIVIDAYLIKKDSSRAQKTSDDLIQIAPDNPIGYFQRGRIFLAQKKEKEAIAQLEKALSIQPDYLEALNLIVALHVSQKEFKKAIERVEAQTKISSSNPFFYNILGHLYEMNREIEKAGDHYKKAIEVNPNFSMFYVSLGDFYTRQNLTERAIQEYTTAIQKDPNSLSAYMSLGILYDTQKKYDKAKECYQKALKINPRFSPAANNLAYLYAEKDENIDEALNLAGAAKEWAPDDPNISDTLGWIYYKKNIFGRAIVYLKEANDKVTDNPVMRYHLGMAYYKNGDHEPAKKELRKALELNPHFPGADDVRATLKLLK
jgi:tetratricopeptide (TPR) repeat protein